MKDTPTIFENKASIVFRSIQDMMYNEIEALISNEASSEEKAALIQAQMYKKPMLPVRKSIIDKIKEPGLVGEGEASRNLMVLPYDIFTTSARRVFRDLSLLRLEVNSLSELVDVVEAVYEADKGSLFGIIIEYSGSKFNITHPTIVSLLSKRKYGMKRAKSIMVYVYEYTGFCTPTEPQKDDKEFLKASIDKSIEIINEITIETMISDMSVKFVSNTGMDELERFMDEMVLSTDTMNTKMSIQKYMRGIIKFEGKEEETKYYAIPGHLAQNQGVLYPWFGMNIIESDGVSSVGASLGFMMSPNISSKESDKTFSNICTGSLPRASINGITSLQRCNFDSAFSDYRLGIMWEEYHKQMLEKAKEIFKYEFIEKEKQ